MRKNVLSLSIAAMIGGLGFAGAAFAGVSVVTTAAGVPAAGATFGATTAASTLTVSPDGIGHILLVPYFTTQNGNGTLLSLVNTDTKNGKAVKVRFRGAANSDDVFDFQVFLSPGDVWTANVSEDAATGLSQIYTPDNSCTLPRAAVLNATKFKTDRVYGADDAAKAGETREGYVEIFNMADIPAQLAGTVAAGVTGVAADGLVANPLYTAIKHTAAGTNPCGLAASDAALPAAVAKLAADPATLDDAGVQKHGFAAPSTGLTGSWTVLNVLGASVAWSGNATALEARDAGIPALGRVVFSPQKDVTVAMANVNKLTADPLLRNNGAAETSLILPAQYDLPDLSTPYTGTAALSAQLPLDQAAALTAALAVKNVVNEYVTNPDISAQTDWVFSMPTRRYAVGVNYAAATKPATVFNTVNVAGVGTEATAVSTYFTAVNTKIGAGGSSGNPIYQACVEPGGAVTAYDQEEATASGEFVVSPGTAKKVLFCGEVSVLTFNGTSALSAKIAPKDIDAGFVNGWMNINTAGLLNGAGPATMGLPILGSSFVQMTGPVVAGKSTNFSITQPHRFTR